MRKYLAISVAFAFLMFMAAAMAQAGGGSAGGGQAGGAQAGGQTGGSQAGAPGGTGTMGTQTEQQEPGAASSQEQGQKPSKSASVGKEHTVEGCIVKEESDYFLVPKRGNPIMLQASGSQNPSAHEGHHVKVKGTEQSASAAGGAGTSGGAAGAAAGAQPATGGEAGQAGAVGSQAGQAGKAGAAGGGGQLHQNASKMIVADEITMVSESCPANWNSKYSGAPKGSSGSQGGSTQTPPPMF